MLSATKTKSTKKTKKFDRQKVFDRVAKHLLKQYAQAVGENGCEYRASNGDSCAVGCLIPDSLYDEEIEGTGISYLQEGSIVYNLESTEKLRTILRKAIGASNDKHYTFLSDLQDIHDDNDPEEWLSLLRAFATQRRLKTSCLAKFAAKNCDN